MMYSNVWGDFVRERCAVKDVPCVPSDVNNDIVDPDSDSVRVFFLCIAPGLLSMQACWGCQCSIYAHRDF